MKLKTALTLLLIATATAIQAQNASSFTLQGNIEGLQEGDTLIIAEYTLPEWTKEKQDTLIVQQANAFTLTFPVEHTTYLSLMHFPKTGKPLPSSKMALSFLARPADKLTLTGTIDYFVLAEIEGGFYNNPLVQ
ncbi:MAG: thiol:disulfide interchange protein, partial [Bacteroidota bacterium]|nr:thiol:disulfide interchange protein [Bacteroidota bacterium]